MYTLIPIDTNNYDQKIIDNINHIYLRSKICIHVMGSEAKTLYEIIKSTPEIKTEYLEFTEEEFNYSKCINKMLESLREEDTVLITDSNTIMPFRHLQETADSNSFNLDNNFISIKCLLDDPYKGKKLDFGHERIHVKIALKLKNTNREKKYISRLILSKKIFIYDLLNGMDEVIKTSLSRDALAEKLISMGLKEVVYEKEALNFSEDQKLLSSYQDENILKLDENTEIIFEKNNVVKKEIKKTNVNTNNIPSKKTSLKDFRLNRVVDNSVNRVKTEETTTRIAVEKFKSDSQILIAVNSNVQSMISITHMLKILKNSDLKVDIITQNKNEKSIKLIDEKYYQHVFDSSDIINNTLDLRTYEHVLKTYKCEVQIPHFINTKNANENVNPITSNFDLLNSVIQYNSERFYPTCKKISTKVFEPNSVFINMGYKKTDMIKWSGFTEIIAKLAKHNILYIANLNTEDYNRSLKQFHINKKINFLENLDLFTSVDLIDSCSVILTKSSSDLFWISVALKKQTIVFEHSEYFLNFDWIVYPHETGVFDKYNFKEYDDVCILEEVNRRI